MDRTMIAEAIQILLIMDNYSVYPNVERLEAVKLVFLPPKIIIYHICNR